MIQPLQRLQTSSEELNRVQDRTVQTVNALAALPLSNAVLTDRVDVGSTYVNVPHKLGRRPIGWLQVSPRAASGVYEDPAQSEAERVLFLRVRVNGATVCSTRFLVF